MVATNAVPFVRGGAELLADALVAELRARGHDADLLRIPLRHDTPGEVADAIFYASTVELRGVDRVIALKFPAYLVRHDSMVVWLLHQFRQVYDLWDTPWGPPVGDPGWRELRESVDAGDRRALGGASRVFANDTVTRDRLLANTGINAGILHPPLPDAIEPSQQPPGDYLLCLGRVSRGKRTDLAVEAMLHTQSAVRLIVAGAPDDEEFAARLGELAARPELSGRVELRLRFVDAAEKGQLIAGSRGVVYLPVDEDSFGYVTAEAMTGGRPVITAGDSGGVLNLVGHEANGLVCEPQPAALGVAYDRLYGSLALAEQWGGAAAAAVASLGLSWDHVIGELLG